MATATCEKCGGSGAYGMTEPAERRELADGGSIVSGPSHITRLCECRKSVAPRDGTAAWWSLEEVYAVDVTVPIFNEQVSIAVRAEVPIGEDNYRVHRRANRYYPTLIEVEAPTSMTLHASTARDLARALIAAADAADRIDDQDTDPRCGHWAPCECSESATPEAATSAAAK